MAQPPIRRHNLWPHQEAAYSFAASRPASLIAASMGTGKSCVAIALLDNWIAQVDDWSTWKAMVLCPTTVRGVWRREIERHAVMPYNVVIGDTGSVASRTRRIMAGIYGSGRPTIVVMNYEAAQYSPFRDIALRETWDAVILDESHRVTPGTLTAHLMRWQRQKARRRLCLTGTPLTQDPLSVWAQCRFLDPSVFGDDFEAFRERYQNPDAVGELKEIARLNEWRAERGEAPVSQRAGSENFFINNSAEYMRKLSGVAFRCENASLRLPPMVVETRTFALSERARELYSAIEAGNLGSIRSGLWSDVNGSYAVTMRLQQIWVATEQRRQAGVGGHGQGCLPGGHTGRRPWRAGRRVRQVRSRPRHHPWDCGVAPPDVWGDQPAA
jgi:hypothetical protein